MKKKLTNICTKASRDKTQPVLWFEDLNELDEYAGYWIQILDLKDWYIYVGLVSTEKMRELNGDVVLGYCQPSWVRKVATISILNDSNSIEQESLKYCQEYVLVHELLHCKFMSMEDSSKKIESVYYEIMQHQLLDTIARALIMSKYNLKSDWFTRV